MLLIRGREASVLNIGGDKVKPELVEEALTAFAGVDQAGAFMRKNNMDVPELWAALVCRAEIDLGGVAGPLRTPARARICPARFHPNRQLPLNAAGKVDRHRLAEIIKSGRA